MLGGAGPERRGEAIWGRPGPSARIDLEPEYRLARGVGGWMTTLGLENRRKGSVKRRGGKSATFQQSADIPSVNGREEERSER